MNKRYMVIILLVGFLLASTPLTQTLGDSQPPTNSVSYQPEATLQDEYSIGTFMDLEKASFTSNGTHLVINATWRDTFPRRSNRSSTLDSTWQNLYLRIDLDGRMDTGYGARFQWYPNKYEVALRAYRDQDGFSTVYMYVYNASGYQVAYMYEQSYIIDVSDRSIAMAIPYSALNISSGTIMTINYIYSSAGITDRVTAPVTAPLPEASIEVDGSPSDWRAEGINPIVRDYSDSIGAGIPSYANITEFYAAVNKSEEMLYIGASMNSVVKDIYREAQSMEKGATGAGMSLYFRLDLDNDGSADYSVTVYKNYVYVYDHAAHRGRSYGRYQGVKEVFLNTSFIEVGIPLRFVGMSGYTPGANITLLYMNMATSMTDYFQSYYGYMTRIIHEVGQGFRTAPSYGAQRNSGGAGQRLILGTVNGTMMLKIKEDAARRVYVDMAEYGQPPLPIDKVIHTLGSYYFIATSNASDLEDRIIFTVSYSESMLTSMGLDATMVRLYYYDQDNGRYILLNKTMVDEDTSSLVAVLSPSLFSDHYGLDTLLLAVSYGPSTIKTVTMTETTTETMTDTATITETKTATITSMQTTTLRETTTSTATTTLYTEKTVTSTATMAAPTTSTLTVTATSSVTHTETVEKTMTKTIEKTASSTTPWIIAAVLGLLSIVLLAMLLLRRS